MKYFNVLTALLIFLVHIQAQNAIPKIIKKSIHFTSTDRSLSIDFDLQDPDNDKLEVRCKIFSLSENDKYTELLAQSITGDVGYPVSPGLNKKINLINIEYASPKLVVVLSAYDKESINIEDIISNVNPNNLKDYVEQIQGRRNANNPIIYNQARTYLSEQLQTYLNTKSLDFKNALYTGINYEATKHGSSEPSSIIIVDAHYDAATISPGADDNGSGVAGVLEMARILADYPSKKSIRYVLFDLEENGLVGSSIYNANQLSKRDSIKAVLNFEMIGYYTEQANTQDLPTGFNVLFPDAYNQVIANNRKGDFIINVGNTNSLNLKNSFHTNTLNHVPALKIISLEVPGNGSIAPDLRRSDHASFWDRNIPALMITDGANFRNKNYHTIRDSSHYLNFDFMANVVKASIATIIELAEIEHGSSIDIIVDQTTGTNTKEENKFQAICEEGCILIKPDQNLENCLLQIFDIKGRKIYSMNQNLRNDNFTKLNHIKLSTGLYFLSLSNKKFKATKKIIIHE
ncbi:MAG: M28 family peptidase [Saprospiraceae bacterium]|nr:M28 family peptidase [Saprospiraceae bacterium]